ncbi:UDP-N-acetylmuramate:L-alanyl-gamma-D-glutamyl-meso-diaminopimelate ligase [Ectothiorhodospiraceae bacterium WFHF3C12]|nr:UDP-N-acetylmuramate:L-alanyl-gamma-D-glutamyl-meso-diaminopimelate ligase [Ectothiorhodospiraceae bacterium WFHF3C12]
MVSGAPSKLHILGICGTFMGGIAVLARQAGYAVSGSDQGVYPPMSDMLRDQGITLHEGYDPGTLGDDPGEVVIGNALSRGNPAVECVLRRRWRYSSGPAWLAEHVLRGQWVLAVSGTHGKTTTASLLAWILEYAGVEPGFLIGGVPGNFGVSARLGGGNFFVLEADEYDTAFFDKRSKFVHFHPDTLVINNIEYDHADIFPDLAAIQRQFHHLVRTVPDNGLIVANGDDANVAETLKLGCWTPVETFGTGETTQWRLAGNETDGYEIRHAGTATAMTSPLAGEHNARNALAAVLAARHAGVPVGTSLEALAAFRGVKRRMEPRGEAAGVQVIDDFAHHPTAIAATLAAMPSDGHRVIAVLEPRSNTMRLGVHRDALAESLDRADDCFLLQPEGIDWDVAAAVHAHRPDAVVAHAVTELADRVVAAARPGDRIVVMSNGGFGGIHELILDGLRQRASTGEAAGE